MPYQLGYVQQKKTAFPSLYRPDVIANHTNVSHKTRCTTTTQKWNLKQWTTIVNKANYKN